MTINPIGLDEAIRLVGDGIKVLTSETVPIAEGTERILAAPLKAAVDSPSAPVALFDGYAVRCQDLAGATDQTPVVLPIHATYLAGAQASGTLAPRTAIRIMTGAMLPVGADAVVAAEQTKQRDDRILFQRPISAGTNVLPAGTDIAAGTAVAGAGQRLNPGLLGLLAAAGFDALPVIRRPRVAIIACGDEVVAPGRPLAAGQLYASNLMTLQANCQRCGMHVATALVPDRKGAIKKALQDAVVQQDAVLTSGGAWSGDRDLVRSVLSAMGWRPIFRRVRMAPGKGVCFGLMGRVPIFVLPGGPAGNFAAFHTLALPALLRLAGASASTAASLTTVLDADLHGRKKDWTQVVFGRIRSAGDDRRFDPLRLPSRLETIARADALVTIPEGCRTLSRGSIVPTTLL